MKVSSSSIFMVFVTLVSLCGCDNNTKTGLDKSDTLKVSIILGSTREGRSSDKLAHYLEQLLAKRTDISTELIDLKDYNLDFLSDETPPMKRKTITDPKIQRWSDVVANADAFIIVVPEYNAGYPGVLKNALDALYHEWNNKPVAFVGYSGGPTGGTSAISQLRAVTKALKMIPVSCEINIPTIWKAFDDQGNLADQTIAKQLDAIVNELIKAYHSN